MKVTASGFAYEKVGKLGQESEQWSILAIYTTQLPTLIEKVLDNNVKIVQCYAKGSGTKRISLLNKYHIGAKIENKQQTIFSMNLKEKIHKCFEPIDQKDILAALKENGIIEPQVEEIVLKFQCQNLVKEINESLVTECEPTLPLDIYFRGRFIAAFCKGQIDKEKVMEHFENETAVQQEHKKIRKLQLRDLIDYNQINSFPPNMWTYWVKYSADAVDDIDSFHPFVAAIKPLFNGWAGCEFYKQGKKNELILVNII